MIFQWLVNDSKQTVHMALPLVGSRVLHALNGFVNMVLIARLGANAIATGALIFSTTSMLFLMMWAVLYSMAVIVGRVYGADKKEEIGQIVKAGLFLGLILGLFFTLLLWNIGKLLIILKQPRDLVALAVPYFHALSIGVIPSLWGVCFNEFVMGIGRARLVVIWALISTPCNILLGYGLLFGKFGLPKLGIVGAAWAASLTYWALFLLVVLYFCRSCEYKKFNLFHKIIAFRDTTVMHYFLKILQIGWPISLQLGAIAASYSFLTYMMGWLGKTSLAAHHIANQWVTLIIMVPYGVAQASSVLVAQALGSKRKLIISLGYAGVCLGSSIVVLTSLLYWIAPDLLIAIYLNLRDLMNNHIVYLATILLMIMGIIQITDTVAVILTGALRGFHDTTVPMLIGISMNWIVSIPLGYVLAFTINLGAVGLYVGFVAGSACSALLLMYRFWYLCRREERLAVC